MKKKYYLFKATALLLFTCNFANSAVAYTKEKLTYYINQSGFQSVPTTDGDHVVATGWYKVNVTHYQASDTSSRGAESIFFVHGFGDTSALFEPTAIALIESQKARDVYAIDLPGHGASTWPALLIYENIDVNEYVNALAQVLTTMIDVEKRKISIISGHSIGGLVVQRLQNSLVNNNPKSSLKLSYGIDKTVLIACDLPAEVPFWSGQMYAQFLIATPPQGGGFLEDNPAGNPMIRKFIFTPPQDYVNLKFSNTSFQLVPSAPSASDVFNLGLNSREPYFAAANISGIDPALPPTPMTSASRLSVGKGIWAAPAKLTVLRPSEDTFFTQSDMDSLAAHLTGDAMAKAKTIVDPEAVHGIPFSKPQLLLPWF
ncbi:MAG: alpha/beta hydrolase [Betaproteobacteria bacterium]